MIDIRLLRDQPDWLQKNVGRKKFACDWERIFALDAKRRQVITETESARAHQKKESDQLAQIEKGSEVFKETLQSLKALSQKVKGLEAELRDVQEEWDSAVLSIPNAPDASVPDGKTEDENVIVSEWQPDQEPNPFAKPHFDIDLFQKHVDFPRGSKVTGAGFPFYRGQMARLVRGMIAFFLDQAQQAGFEEMMVPLMVNEDSARATGQLPDKEGQMYTMESEGQYLIPTAEVPVTNFYRDEVFQETDLPRKHCAWTPCFRREAGSWGAHVRGLNRLHQFDKVEWVKWVLPEQSMQALESLQASVQALLKALGLRFRLALVCVGEIGFPHAKQYDLEVWAPGQKRWLEVSSCSNFTDFQARRANIRVRRKESGLLEYVHTLNGSGLAIPRTLAALIEQGVQEDGSIRIPEVLHAYCGFDRLH